MRIGVDILSAALGGPGQYFKRLLPHLARRAGNDELHVAAAHPKLINAMPRPENVTIHEIPAGRRPASRLLWQRFRMPAWAERLGIDVMFVPQGLTAMTSGPPFVVMHQDAMFLCRERYERSRVYTAVQQWMARRTLARATRTLYVSRAIRDLAESRGWLRPDTSSFVPYGIDADELRSGVDPAQAGRLAADGAYLLTVGSIMPHKNVHTLVEAVVLLHHRGRTDIRLLIVGDLEHNPEYAARISRRIDAAKLGHAVRLVGRVERSGLGAYYESARLYVSLSVLESLGLTLLEAMALDLPVLCNRLPAFEESCGDAAQFVDGTDAEAAADAVAALWDDDARRQELIQLGRRRYRDFEWSHVA
ncbi:MAG: glycosyltransferase, partial [Phycisphaerae bacterium]